MTFDHPTPSDPTAFPAAPSIKNINWKQVGLFIGPLFLVSVLNCPVMYGYLMGGIVGVAANLVAAFLPLWLARKKVATLARVSTIDRGAPMEDRSPAGNACS
jgi:hypothetical protein